jgi:hypothetical protein
MAKTSALEACFETKKFTIHHRCKSEKKPKNKNVEK